MRILYLEDNPTDVDTVLKIIGAAEPTWDVHVVDSLREAHGALGSNRTYDLALIDVNLPDGSGLDLLRHIRGDQLGLAAVVLTGTGDETNAVNALKSGADDYVVKSQPHLERLPVILKDALDRFRKESDRRSRSLRVLYAEPNVDDVDLTTRHFAREAPHIRIESVSTGASAQERLAASIQERPFDVLLLDYRLPGMNALDFIKTLRQVDGIDIPAVLITGHGSEETAVQALRLGFTDYLTKDAGYLHKLPMVLENATIRVQLFNERNRLKKSEEKYRLLVENAGEGILVVKKEKILFANGKAEAITGYPAAELTTMDLGDIVHPEDTEMVIRRHHERSAGKAVKNDYEFRIVHHSGERRWVSLNGVLIDWEGGAAILNFFTDVTDKVNAQKDREALEAQFRQAQKMEAVGRLAGGVAHDFNNMLSVINGYADIVIEKLNPADPLYADMKEIQSAGARSAKLTRQLLAFARKQVMMQVVLDLNRLIGENEKMLRRLIGEDISLDIQLNPDLWRVKMDPSQVDQILANLSVNSRDAISGVGHISIETDNITLDEAYCRLHPEARPGDYAVVAFGDSGCGMDKETQTKIFEPFFTTKGEGRGTGLGLSTIYGIVQQNGGFANVYSEPGEGTIIRVYIPRFEGDQAESVDSPRDERPLGGNETILVVEDEAQIMRLCQRILKNSGYRVITADKPGEAIVLCEKHDGDIDLLITDVVMPSMNGKELQQRIAAIRPDIKTLYMSGYTANIIARRGIQAEGNYFIQKPFSTKALLQRVRMILDHD